MYLREAHAEHDIPVLRTFIRENPLGIFTTAIDCPPYPFLQSSHIPWILDVSDESSDTELGILRGHMARANPQSKAMMESLDKLRTIGPATLER
jgi:predicted FMN-binding regulatory protein PaiB